MPFYLKKLHIQNVATFLNQTISFDTGFTVITGETGAGKSLLLKAIQLLLGEKSSNRLIRTGHDFLLVEAEFAITKYADLEHRLLEMGMPCDEDKLLIKRIVYQTGKNQIYINHSVAKVKHLTQIAPFLLSLEGQHAQQDLLKQDEALFLYNDFVKIADLQQAYTSLFTKAETLRLALEKQRKAEEDSSAKQDFLSFQIQEIKEANFTTEEIQNIQEEHTRLTHADTIKETLLEVVQPQKEEADLLSILQNQWQQVKEVIKLDSKIENMANMMEEALINYEEAIHEIQNYVTSLESNTNRLDSLNERLSLLDKLKSKYGTSWEEIEKKYYALEVEKNQLEQQTNTIKEQEQEYIQLQKELEVQARQLTQKRTAPQEKFNKAVTENLVDLGMERSQFVVSIMPKEKLGLYGKDTLSFQIATNAGMPLQKLENIASGGELSRIMLGLKTVIAEKQNTKPLLFDEIDTGISGVIAQKLAQKLALLSQNTQVISITHSPQVAALATNHLHISKEVKDNISLSQVKLLKTKERIEVIAGFLSGEKVNEETRKAATGLLNEQLKV